MITKRRIAAVLATGTLLAGGLAGSANAAAEPNDNVKVCGHTVTQKLLKAAGITPGQAIDCTEPEAGVPAVPAVPAIPATPGESEPSVPGVPSTPGQPPTPGEPTSPGEEPTATVPTTGK